MQASASQHEDLRIRIDAEWRRRCRADELVSRSQLPSDESNLPGVFVDWAFDADDAEGLVAEALALATDQISVEVALRQVSLLAESADRENEISATRRLVPAFGVCCEAISSRYVRAAEDVARTDPMTGLPNERAFNQDIESVLRGEGKQSLVLAVLDLDGLKVANDDFGGHKAGDHYVRRFGSQLAGAVRRRGGRVYRWHAKGDEFCLMFEHDDLDGVHQIVEELRGRDDVPPFCFGIAVSPADGSTPEEITVVADEERLNGMKKKRSKEERQQDARDWLESEHWDFESNE